MDINLLLERTCGNSESFDLLKDNWGESVTSLPEETPYFLKQDNIREFRNYCRMDPGLDEILTSTAEKIAADPDLKIFSWHLHQTLCKYPEPFDYTKWPRPEKILGDEAGVFALLVALSIVPVVRKKYAEMGTPEDIIHDTLLEIGCFNEFHKTGFDGKPGIIFDNFGWLRNYVEGRLFRLGRMEYKLREFPHTVEVYRHKENRKVVALSADGICYNNAGYVVDEAASVSKAEFYKSDTEVKGVVISPKGMSTNHVICLSLDEWEHVLGEGEQIIDVHIPAGGGLTPEACEDSMKKAATFFDHFFPDVKTRAFYCHSWIFNTQLEEILPASNLVKFMEELFLFPVPSERMDGFRFVFCRGYDDLSEAPRDTRLQRGMLDILEGGGSLRSGGMFFLKDDLGSFGSRYYRINGIEKGYTKNGSI